MKTLNFILGLMTILLFFLALNQMIKQNYEHAICIWLLLIYLKK